MGKEMSVFAKITSKGQTTLPAQIRADLGVGPGDRLEYIKQPDGRIVVQKARHGLEALRGIIKVDAPVNWDEIDRLIAQRRGRP